MNEALTRRRRRRRHSAGELVGTHAAGLLAVVLCAGPILLVALASFRSTLFSDLSPAPENWTLANYSALLGDPVVLRWIVNSLLVAAAVTALTVAVDVLAAFAFAKLRFPGRTAVFGMLLATLMLPFSVTLLPTYLIASRLNLVDTYAGLIVPAIAGPFGVYLLRQFILKIPESLMDAARIDGASTLRIFRSVVLPLCLQPMAVLAIFVFVANWNSFLWPLLIAQSDDVKTIPVGMAVTNTQFSVNVNGITAMAMLSLLPMAVLFLSFQRYFIRGVLAGAFKG
ncbi:carbohydrate ABC transporter permease [Micromonospora sp. NPDC052213]|uniref:carbohydrate ABC transporter permease n=1 Tax=Micromonospora sp. NPDC052213 TaxID=3155812 RepID=UPI0034214E8E